jgi:hypothetical protein
MAPVATLQCAIDDKCDLKMVVSNICLFLVKYGMKSCVGWNLHINTSLCFVPDIEAYMYTFFSLDASITIDRCYTHCSHLVYTGPNYVSSCICLQGCVFYTDVCFTRMCVLQGCVFYKDGSRYR